MFSALSNLLQLSISPSSWEPHHPTPRGFNSTKSIHKSLISNSSSIHFSSSGFWSGGTIVFTQKDDMTSSNSEPPSYSSVMRTADDEKREMGQIRNESNNNLNLVVEVECRYNDEGLFNDTRVELSEVSGGNHINLVVITPNMVPSRLLSQISFHITIYIPTSINSLQLLKTDGAHWKHIGDETISNIMIKRIQLKTSNANIEFASLQGDAIEMTTSNGSIIGQYYASSISAATVNAIVEGKFVSLGNLKIRNANGSISGSYSAVTQDIKTSNAKISGHFTTSNKLQLETANAAIEAKISLTSSIDEIEGSRSSTPDLLDNELSPMTKVDVKLSTSNAKIAVDFLEHSNSILLNSNLYSSNAAIFANHRTPFEGFFELSTSNSTTTVEVPSTHSVLYSLQDRSKRIGSILRVGSHEDAVGKNHSSASTSNASISLTVST